MKAFAPPPLALALALAACMPVENTTIFEVQSTCAPETR